LAGGPEEAQGRGGTLGCLRSRDVAALRADRVGGECEPDGRDARERRRGRAVRGEPVLGVGQVPEIMKGALLEGVEKRGGVAGRVGRGRPDSVVGGAAGERHREEQRFHRSRTKPILSSAAPISGFALNSFQMSPVRQFSISTTIGAWFSPMKIGDLQCYSELMAPRKPCTPHTRSLRSRL